MASTANVGSPARPMFGSGANADVLTIRVAIIALVVPLPLEPVTWTVIRPWWGSLSRERSDRTEATLMAGLADF